MKKFRFGIVVLVALIAGACSQSENPLTGPSASGDGSGRVSLLGAPPNSNVGPGAGTGTDLGIGGANSCPTEKPDARVNVSAATLDDGRTKIDLRWSKVTGNVRHYSIEVERRSSANVFGNVQRFIADTNITTTYLPEGVYRYRVAAVFTGCGVVAWSEWAPFSVNGPVVTE